MLMMITYYVQCTHTGMNLWQLRGVAFLSEAQAVGLVFSRHTVPLMIDNLPFLCSAGRTHTHEQTKKRANAKQPPSDQLFRTQTSPKMRG